MLKNQFSYFYEVLDFVFFFFIDSFVGTMKAVSDQEVMVRSRGKHWFKNLVNCVVFSMKGITESSLIKNLIGNDHNGERYFISWNRSLIPPSIQ